VAVNLALGLVPHRAGIEENQVGFAGADDLAITGLLKQIDDPLRIDYIHLAPEGFQIKFLVHKHAIIPLPADSRKCTQRGKEKSNDFTGTEVVKFAEKILPFGGQDTACRHRRFEQLDQAAGMLDT
jgi:hypothetical protein